MGWKRKVQRRRMPGSKSKLLLLLLNLTILISDHSVSGWIAGSSNAAAYWNGGSKEAKPVVVINRRHVPTDPDKLEAYNEAHKAATLTSRTRPWRTSSGSGSTLRSTTRARRSTGRS